MPSRTHSRAHSRGASRRHSPAVSDDDTASLVPSHAVSSAASPDCSAECVGCVNEELDVEEGHRLVHRRTLNPFRHARQVLTEYLTDPGKAESGDGYEELEKPAKWSCRRKALVGAAIGAAVTLVLAYVGSVVYSCGPYISGTGPEVVKSGPQHKRVVWHHAAMRRGRFAHFERPSPCPARDTLGIESDVRLHRGRLALHHNIFTPLFPPYWVTGTMLVREMVEHLQHEAAPLHAAYHRKILKLDNKQLPVTRLLAGMDADRPDVDRRDLHRTMTEIDALRARPDTEVWVHGDYAAHPSITDWDFAGTPPAVTAALLARYDVLSIGLKWPSSMDDVMWSASGLRPMVDFALRTIAAVGDPAVLRRARITLCMRWPQLLSDDAAAAANAATAEVAAALDAAASTLERRHGLVTPKVHDSERRVFVTVWKKHKDRALEDADFRWLEAKMPGITTDSSGVTPVSTDCRKP